MEGERKCMKIISTDNHGSDYPDEKVIAEGIIHIPFADCMCAALNAKYCPDSFSRRYYKVVPDDYILRPGFEP